MRYSLQYLTMDKNGVTTNASALLTTAGIGAGTMGGVTTNGGTTGSRWPCDHKSNRKRREHCERSCYKLSQQSNSAKD